MRNRKTGVHSIRKRYNLDVPKIDTKKLGLIRCSFCKTEIEHDAHICPHCRQFQDWRKHIPAITLISISLGLFAALFGIFYPMYRDAEAFFWWNRPALILYSGGLLNLNEGKMEFTVQNDGEGVALFDPTILCMGKVIEAEDSIGEFIRPNSNKVRMTVIFQADGSGVISAGSGKILKYSMYLGFTKDEILMHMYRSLIFQANMIDASNFDEKQIEELTNTLKNVSSLIEKKVEQTFSKGDLDKRKLIFWENYSNEGVWNCEITATDVDNGLFWDDKFDLVILASDAINLDEAVFLPYGFEMTEQEQSLHRITEMVKSMENRRELETQE